MNNKPFHLGYERKIGYSFLGWLTGNLIALVFSVVNSIFAIIPRSSTCPAPLGITAFCTHSAFR
jgi:hypothetical protein